MLKWVSSQAFCNITHTPALSNFSLLVQGCSLEHRAVPNSRSVTGIQQGSRVTVQCAASSPWMGSFLFYRWSSACGSALWCSKRGHIPGTPAANLLMKILHVFPYVCVILDVLSAWFIVEVWNGTFWCCPITAWWNDPPWWHPDGYWKMEYYFPMTLLL